MYFPYLRGKQYELLALREESIFLANKKNIIPIIEPVKDDKSPLIKAIKALNRALAPFILIVNPQDGELANQTIDVIDEADLAPNSNGYLGFIINYKTTLKSIENFLNKYRDYRICFIHFSDFRDLTELRKIFGRHPNIEFQIFIDGAFGKDYQDSFSDSNRALIKDSFRKAKKNSEYKGREDEFFSDAHLNYKKLGFQGFGDFTVIGSDYESSGGPAYSVAIHFTYLKISELRIRHFVSDRLPESILDRGGKFLEALGKMIKFIEDNPQFDICDSCNEFQSLYRSKEFPQLGHVKKLSIKHHLHTIKHLI